MSEIAFRRSALENFLLKAVTAAAALGAFFGWFLPRTVWRTTTGTTTLGDFALVCLLGLVSWAIASRTDLGSAGIGLLITGWIAAFGLREVAWRFSPLVLAIFYGVVVMVLVVTLLGSFAYEVRAGRPLASLLTPERVLSVIVGMVVLVWLALATILSWLTS